MVVSELSNLDNLSLNLCRVSTIRWLLHSDCPASPLKTQASHPRTHSFSVLAVLVVDGPRLLMDPMVICQEVEDLLLVLTTGQVWFR